MKVSVEEISSIKKKVNIEISEEDVAKEIGSFYKELGRKAKIKGFRPGKVPRSILERYFKDYVKAEVMQKLIQVTYPNALTETNLQPVSNPVIDPGELETGSPFQYSATIEVKPEIKLEGYIGLNIQGKKEEVKEEELEERLRTLQNLHASLKAVSEARPVQNGDYVIIDYETREAGKPLEEGKATDTTLEVGSGRFIPEVEEKLTGMKLGEEREIEVTFPEDYGYKKWAGKAISFHVKIKEIKEKILPPLDDEFAKDIGDYSSLDELKFKLREEIRKEKESYLQQQLRNQILDQLLEANPFEVPDSLVEAQTQAMISDTKLRLARQGMALQDIGVTEEKLREDYRTTAMKQVKTFLILEKIASQEGISVTDEEAEERIREISEKVHQKFDVLKRYYEKNGLIPEVKAEILNNKTLDFLIQKANIIYT